MADLRLYGFSSVRPPVNVGATDVRGVHGQTTKSGHTSFRDVLEQTRSERKIIWSKHAQQRLRNANIEWNERKETQLVSAVQQAAAKGGRSSLVFMSDVAFVVNIPNRTVITAVESGRMNEHVFTQIDSAVIVPQE